MTMRWRFAVLVLIALTGCRAHREGAWHPQPLGTSADFRGIWFADPLHGWIAGGAYDIAGGLIGRTRDGGKSWQFRSAMNGTSNSSIEALHFFDAEHGLAAADGGNIYSTSDGGENWGQVRQGHGATDYLFGFHFAADQKGWAVGLRGVITTGDGGSHWTELARRSTE